MDARDVGLLDWSGGGWSEARAVSHAPNANRRSAHRGPRALPPRCALTDLHTPRSPCRWQTGVISVGAFVAIWIGDHAWRARRRASPRDPALHLQPRILVRGHPDDRQSRGRLGTRQARVSEGAAPTPAPAAALRCRVHAEARTPRGQPNATASTAPPPIERGGLLCPTACCLTAARVATGAWRSGRSFTMQWQRMTSHRIARGRAMAARAARGPRTQLCSS